MKAKQLTIELVQGDTFSKTIKVYAQSNLEYRGKFSTAYAYQTNDVVLYQNVVYYSKSDANKANLPTNTTYWGTLTPVNLTGATIVAKFEEQKSDTASNFTVTITDAVNGVFTIGLTSVQTQALSFNMANYDISINGTTYIFGNLLLHKEIV